MIDSFYNREQSGGINAVYEVEQALAKVRTVPGSCNAALISIRDSIEAKTTQINQRLSSLSAASTANDSANLYLQANRLLAERSVFSRNLISLQEQMKTERLLHINTSLSVVNSLDASNVYKQNFKTVSRIYLETVGQGLHSLSTSQFSEISAIAHQCPKIGGTAVYMARSLYLLNAVKQFKDDSLCQIGKNRSLFLEENKISNSITIRPNPANDRITVTIPTDLLIDGIPMLEITDLNGRIIYSQKIPSSGDHFIPTSLWASGVYICRITGSERVIQPLKFTIQH